MSNIVEALLSLSKSRPRKNATEVVVASQVKSRKRKNPDVVVATLVEEEDHTEQTPKEDDHTEEDENKYADTKNLILGDIPFILNEHHIDHLNHVMTLFSNKKDGHTVLVEMVHVPSVFGNSSFIEYALLTKKKEKWVLFFKRTADSKKVYWNSQFLRENCFGLNVPANTMGATKNFRMYLTDQHVNHIKKSLVPCPDGLRVLIGTTIYICKDGCRKIHSIISKLADQFTIENKMTVFEDNKIYWDKICTTNMFIASANKCS